MRNVQDWHPSVLGNLTANGNTDWKPVNRGRFLFVVSGAMGGGNVEVQYSPDDGTTAVNLTNPIDENKIVQISSDNVAYEISVGNGQIRGVLAGGTGPNVTLQIVRVEP